MHDLKFLIYHNPDFMAYMNKEWTEYIRFAVKQMKRGETVYIAPGSPMWVAFKKEQRNIYKNTLRYKLFKVSQAFRILAKICIRQWFKIRL